MLARIRPKSQVGSIGTCSCGRVREWRARPYTSVPLRWTMASRARHSAAAPRMAVVACSVYSRALRGLARLCGSHTEMCTTTCGLNLVTTSIIRSRSSGGDEVELGRAQPPAGRIDVDADELTDPRLGLEQGGDARPEVAAHPAHQHPLSRHQGER